MLILDTPSRAPEGVRYIELPMYHRAHLGASAARLFHACLLPNASIRASKGKFSDAPELIVSAFPFESWDRAWRITLDLDDRPGLVHDVIEVIARYNPGLLFVESGITQESAIHSLELLVSLPNNHCVSELRWALGAKFFHEMSFGTDGSERLSVRPIQTLQHAKALHKHLNDNVGMHAERQASFSPIHGIVELEVERPAKNVSRLMKLKLPPTMRQIVKSMVREGQSPHREKFGYILRMSDTKDRFLRVLFLKQSDPILHARIEFAGGLKTLREITRNLLLEEFNLVSTMCTPLNLSRLRFEVIARAEWAASGGIGTLKERLAHALEAVPDGAEIDLSYPRGYSDDPQTARIEFDGTTGPAPLPAKDFFGDLKRSLDAARGALLREYADGTVGKAYGPRKAFLLSLLWERAHHEVGRQKHVLFISTPFSGIELSVIKERAVHFQFVVRTGENLNSAPTIRAGVARRIQSCTHFLGVWSPKNGFPINASTCWPSTWLLWEAGVAAASQAQHALLVHESVVDDSWKRIYADQQVTKYDDQDFLAKLDAVLASLANQAPSLHDIDDLSD